MLVVIGVVGVVDVGVEGVVGVGCSCRSELGVNKEELLYGWSVC
jgi:hypothetical protein